MTATTRGIKSIEVGGRILSELIHASAPMMLKDLAVATDLTPAQAHAYLTSYRASGLVEQDQQTGLYRVGPFAIRLGAGRLRHEPYLAATRSAVDRLAIELGLMVTMVVLGPRGPTVVYVQQAEEPLGINVRPGTLFSIVGTASGQIFAAFSQDERVNQLIDDELNNQTKTLMMANNSTPKEFEKAINRIRKRGYSYVEGTAIPGINAVSVPICNASDQLSAVITLIGQDTDLDVQADSPSLQRLLLTAQSIPQNIT